LKYESLYIDSYLTPISFDKAVLQTLHTTAFDLLPGYPMETSLLAIGLSGARQWVSSWNGDPECSLAGQLLASREFTTNACVSDDEDTTIISPLARLRQIEESRFMPLAITEPALVPRTTQVPAEVARDEQGQTQNNRRLESHDRIHNYEWEKRKSEIEHLYVDHSLPLPRVMATMERNGFRAS
jgi:hypothetical protein